MNPDTGELRRLLKGESRDGFEPLPDSLQLIARMKMARREAEAINALAPARVNLRSRSPLAEWAKKKRKAKIAAASRRRNRK